LVGLIEKRVGSVLDLGCGSSKAALPLLSAGVAYTGIDIQEAALTEARANFARIAGARGQAALSHPEAMLADVREDRWLTRLKTGRWDAVVGNLPYLPGPPNVLPIVDGGEDGLRFSPIEVLRIADALSAQFAVINISSICDLSSFSSKVAASGYGAVHVVATVAPLGEYSTKVLSYLKQQKFARLYGIDGDLRQVIYAFTLI
jgi:methylase of polypeptide subunit release factors